NCFPVPARDSLLVAMVRSPEQIQSGPPPAGAGRSTPEPSPSPARPPLLLPKRRWPRRVLIGLNIFVALCLVAAGGTYGYFEWKFGSLHKIGFDPGTIR